MRLFICGTRGSTPAPGPEFVRYGGHTSCVAVAHDGAAPSLVLDGGTGLRRLSAELNGAPFVGSILIGHLHWDHTHGLPFFRAGDNPDASCTVLIPEQGNASDVMARVISPPHFPVRLEELRGNWTLAGLEEGTHQIEGFEVRAVEVPHKNSRTFGFRISDGKATVAYISDHWPTADGVGPDGIGEYHDAIMSLADGVDLLIHDAQYTAEEFPARATFGHSVIEYPVRLAEKAGARSVLLFHHDPDRTDDQLDKIVAEYQGRSVMVGAAVEGTKIDLP